jgi:hypothetical protein
VATKQQLQTELKVLKEDRANLEREIKEAWACAHKFEAKYLKATGQGAEGAAPGDLEALISTLSKVCTYIESKEDLRPYSALTPGKGLHTEVLFHIADLAALRSSQPPESAPGVSQEARIAAAAKEYVQAESDFHEGGSRMQDQDKLDTTWDKLRAAVTGEELDLEIWEVAEILANSPGLEAPEGHPWCTVAPDNTFRFFRTEGAAADYQREYRQQHGLPSESAGAREGGEE